MAKWSTAGFFSDLAQALTAIPFVGGVFGVAATKLAQTARKYDGLSEGQVQRAVDEMKAALGRLSRDQLEAVQSRLSALDPRFSTGIVKDIISATQDKLRTQVKQLSKKADVEQSLSNAIDDAASRYKYASDRDKATVAKENFQNAMSDIKTAIGGFKNAEAKISE